MSNITVESPLVRAWKPHAKQEKFISLAFDINEGFYGGAMGGGKTDALLMMPLLYNFHENPKYKGITLRRTFPELEKEIIIRSKQWYDSTGGTYNESKRRWEWKGGATHFFGHCEKETDVKKYDGVEYNLVQYDEAPSFTQYQYEYLTLERCRTSAFDLPAIARSSGMPGGIGHSYFRKRFVDPCRDGGKVIVERNKKGDIVSRRVFIPCIGRENPHLLENNPLYFDRLELSDDKTRLAKVTGDWYTFSGQVFTEWRVDPLQGEPDNAKHVLYRERGETFEIPNWWPQIIAIDWGFNAFTFIAWFAIAPNGRVYVYRTYAEKGKRIKEWIRDLTQLTGANVKSVRDVRICHSAVQSRGEDQTIFKQVEESLKDAGFSCGVTLGEKDRIAGKQLVHEYFRWNPIEKIYRELAGEFDQDLADRIMRTCGSQELEKYLRYFKDPEPELNLPKLQIFDHSPEGRENNEIIDAIPNCVYDDIKTEDVKDFSGDDPYDGLRIGLYAVRDYFSSCAVEAGERLKVDVILKRLERSGDQTAFYRQMEKLESTQTTVSYGVRRSSFRRRR